MILLKHSCVHSFCIDYDCFCITMAEMSSCSIWPTKFKMFTICPFTEKDFFSTVGFFFFFWSIFLPFVLIFIIILALSFSSICCSFSRLLRWILRSFLFFVRFSFNYCVFSSYRLGISHKFLYVIFLLPFC